MEDVDTQEMADYDEEHLFLHEVIQEDHELLFLECCLREALTTVDTI